MLQSDQYMAALRTVIAQGRKRIGFLIGAGGPAGMAKDDGTYPLIPAVAGLTAQVLATLSLQYVAVVNRGIGSADLFRQGGVEFLRVAWVAAEFGRYRQSSLVRLVAEREQWADF
jgi:hypothetical protein